MPLPDVPDTYRMIVRQAVSGQEVLNVFYARDTALGGPSPLSVADGFWQHIKTAWRAWMPASATLLTQEIECEALFGAHPFGIFPIPVGEQQGVRAAPTDFYALTVAGLVTLQVSTRLTRPGSKRLVGLLEGDVGGGSTLIAGSLAILQTLADRFDITFTAVPSGIVMTPVIVGYPTDDQPGAPRVQDITGAVASGFVSHQVSRDQRP
jgi:hypothetical protein